MENKSDGEVGGKMQLTALNTKVWQNIKSFAFIRVLVYRFCDIVTSLCGPRKVFILVCASASAVGH